ncbi:hypothetical protein P171DRAFT_41298 [Karstenula rhodostoma CBS 690.94]|uniref:Uncharacterized protein n=1 Tax=Karstenula rhodostoma CBS 690.94 TaxID=1392251 RepID=A0A9P4PIQ1_9PLEO|nr:hypothetical protein P171DRAFT_41298 [Karstenula rhodostoma CBS 690.94]
MQVQTALRTRCLSSAQLSRGIKVALLPQYSLGTRGRCCRLTRSPIALLPSCPLALLPSRSQRLHSHLLHVCISSFLLAMELCECPLPVSLPQRLLYPHARLHHAVRSHDSLPHGYSGDVQFHQPSIQSNSNQLAFCQYARVSSVVVAFASNAVETGTA